MGPQVVAIWHLLGQFLFPDKPARHTGKHPCVSSALTPHFLIFLRPRLLNFLTTGLGYFFISRTCNILPPPLFWWAPIFLERHIPGSRPRKERALWGPE